MATRGEKGNVGGINRQTSRKQVAANRRNAQESTGSRSEAGRAKSSSNALRNGIYVAKLRPVTSRVPAANQRVSESWSHGLIDFLDSRNSIEYALSRWARRVGGHRARVDLFQSFFKCSCCQRRLPALKGEERNPSRPDGARSTGG